MTRGSAATTKMAAAMSCGVRSVFFLFSVFSSCLAWFGGGEAFKRQVRKANYSKLNPEVSENNRVTDTGGERAEEVKVCKSAHNLHLVESVNC